MSDQQVNDFKAKAEEFTKGLQNLQSFALNILNYAEKENKKNKNKDEKKKNTDKIKEVKGIIKEIKQGKLNSNDLMNILCQLKS